MLRFAPIALSNPNRPDLAPVMAHALVVSDNFRIAISEEVVERLDLQKIATKPVQEIGKSTPADFPLFGPLRIDHAGAEAFSGAIVCGHGVVIGKELADQLQMDSYVAPKEIPEFLRPHFKHKVGNKNRILKVDNAVSADICAKIVERVSSQPRHRLGVLDVSRGKDLPQRSYVDTSERDTHTVFMDEDLREMIKHIFYNMITDHVEPFFGKQIYWWECPQLLLYEKGGRYDPHVDADRWVDYPDGRGAWEPYLDRHVSLLLYLNESFTGGALNFPDQKFKIQPKTGMLAAFPSSAEFRHGAEPTESGERLVLVSWATVKGRKLFNQHPAYAVYYRDDFTS